MFEKEKPYEEIIFKLNQEGQEGLVIISSTKKGEEELEEIKKKIMASFSDKLELIPKNKSSKFSCLSLKKINNIFQSLY